MDPLSVGDLTGVSSWTPLRLSEAVRWVGLHAHPSSRIRHGALQSSASADRRRNREVFAEAEG